jgi:hypothetical protein
MAVDFIREDFVDCDVKKKLTESKPKREPRLWRFTDYSNCKKWPELFSMDSAFRARGRSTFWWKADRAQQMEPMELTVGPKGMCDLWILGKPYTYGSLLWCGVHLRSTLVGKRVLCPPSCFCTYVPILDVGSLDKGARNVELCNTILALSRRPILVFRGVY